MKQRIFFSALLATALLLAPAISHARWMDPSTGRFQTMDSYEGNQQDPQSLHRYTYAHNDPVNRIDPSGQAVYFVERRMSVTGGTAVWYGGNSGHGYLLFTSPSSSGSLDPFATGESVIDSFSFHPYVWGYWSEERRNPWLPGVPSRVWEKHPDDMDPRSPGIPYHTFLVTANPAQQTILLNFVNNWIHTMPVGYEKGDPIPDTNQTGYHKDNFIGALHNDPAPENGIYYSLWGQNCVWWTTIMLKQSGIPVSDWVYQWIAAYNGGAGYASDVIAGKRRADKVGTLGARLPYAPSIVDLSSMPIEYFY